MNRKEIRTAEAQWRATDHRKTVPMQGTRPKQPVLKWAKRVAIVVFVILCLHGLAKTQQGCEAMNGANHKLCTD